MPTRLRERHAPARPQVRLAQLLVTAATRLTALQGGVWGPAPLALLQGIPTVFDWPDGRAAALFDELNSAVLKYLTSDDEIVAEMRRRRLKA